MGEHRLLEGLLVRGGSPRRRTSTIEPWRSADIDLCVEFGLVDADAATLRGSGSRRVSSSARVLRVEVLAELLLPAPGTRSR